MFDAHANHIEKNADHDENIELLIRCQIEKESSDRKLWKKKRKKLNSNSKQKSLKVFTRGRGKAFVGFLLPIFFIAL